MTTTAYLVAFLDKQTGNLQGLEVYSEPMPTASTSWAPAVVLKRPGDTFGEAKKSVESAADELWPEWRALRKGHKTRSIITPQDIAPVLSDAQLKVFNKAVQRNFDGERARVDYFEPSNCLRANMDPNTFRYACVLMERAGWVRLSDTYYVGSFELPTRGEE